MASVTNVYLPDIAVPSAGDRTGYPEHSRPTHCQLSYRGRCACVRVSFSKYFPFILCDNAVDMDQAGVEAIVKRARTDVRYGPGSSSYTSNVYLRRSALFQALFLFLFSSYDYSTDYSSHSRARGLSTTHEINTSLLKYKILQSADAHKQKHRSRTQFLPHLQRNYFGI